MDFLQSIISFIMAIIAFFASLLGIDINIGETEKIDMSKFELVWADEFEGDSLDLTKWNPQGNSEVRRGGYWNKNMQEVKDGNLVIFSEYFENGYEEGDPAGWYTTAVTTQNKFDQTFGYFETRCILPAGVGQWSALWMNSSVYPPDGADGSYGGELDIFEGPYYNYDDPDRVFGAIHWGGYGEGHQSISVTYKIDPVDPYHSYNTYGFKWNENEYIYYVNGEVTARVEKDRVVHSLVPHYIILSTEFSGSEGDAYTTHGIGDMDDNGKDYRGEFIVDYVRVYQYKPTAETA
ncbi:MAG: glycoside hydrolase family 16 protein [Clostridia bacterium]|nr:glycoside hydrolase family 16 protein [Clostridia bacterium]